MGTNRNLDAGNDFISFPFFFLLGFLNLLKLFFSLVHADIIIESEQIRFKFVVELLLVYVQFYICCKISFCLTFFQPFCYCVE